MKLWDWHSDICTELKKSRWQSWPSTAPICCICSSIFGLYDGYILSPTIWVIYGSIWSICGLYTYGSLIGYIFHTSSIGLCSCATVFFIEHMHDIYLFPFDQPNPCFLEQKVVRNRSEKTNIPTCSMYGILANVYHWANLYPSKQTWVLTKHEIWSPCG